MLTYKQTVRGFMKQCYIRDDPVTLLGVNLFPSEFVDLKMPAIRVILVVVAPPSLTQASQPKDGKY